MKKRHILFIVLLLVAILLGGVSMPAQTAVAQGEVIYYFPLFKYEEDPLYYFGLDGGTVEGIVIDPTESDTLYANSWGAGVFKSIDGGQTWVNTSAGLASSYIYELAIDPSNPSHILASDYEHGVKQSINGGETWEAVSGLPPWCVIYSIDFNPQNPAVVYVALREPTYSTPSGSVYPGGVFKSTDGGASWTRKSSGLPNDYVYDLAIDPNNPNTIYTAQHRTGVYKTINGGESWTNTTSNMIDQDVRSVEVTPDSSRVNIGFWDGYGFSYSTDGGAHWTSVQSTNNANLYVYEVQVDPHHPSDVYLTTSTGIYLCQNPSAFSVCTVRAHGGLFAFDLALDVNNLDNTNGYTEVMYTGLQNFAIYKSASHGASFKPMYQGIRANIINQVLVDPLDPDRWFVSALNRGLFRTEDGGLTWQALHGSIPVENISSLAIHPNNSDVIYVGTQSNGLAISYDGGDHWTYGNTGLTRGEEADVDLSGSDPLTEEVLREMYSWMDEPDLADMLSAQAVAVDTRATAYQNVTAIDFDPNNAQYMLAGTNGAGVRLSNDGGLSWYASGNLTSGNVTDLLVNPFAAPNLFLAALDGSYVKVSSNRMSWVTWSSGLPAQVFALDVVPGTTTIFAGTSSGIYRTTGDGNWQKMNMPNVKVTDIQVDPGNPARVLATTLDGLYVSGDSGANWSRYIDPVNLYNVKMLTITPVADGGGGYYFLIGTDGGDYYEFAP